MATAQCIFCGGHPTTRAHILRKGWIDGLTPGVAAFRHRHVRREPADPFDRTWPNSDVDFKVGVACATCNSVWMNDLDHAAEDVFATRAALGYPVKLSRLADKKTVARWCSLVAVLFDQAQKVPRLGTEVHHALYEGEVPPGAATWLVATAAPAPTEPIAFAHARDLHLTLPEDGVPDSWDGESSPGPDAFVMTFGVGRLLAQVCLPLSDEFADVSARRHGDWAMLRQLWPDTLVPLVWPPPRALARDRVEAFSRSFRYVEAKAAAVPARR